MNTDQAREHLRRYIDRRGHGALKSLAEGAGMSPLTVKRFLNGHDIYLSKYTDLMRQLAEVIPDGQEGAGGAEECRQGPAEKQAGPPLIEDIATALEGVCLLLRSGLIPRETRLQTALASLQALSEAIQKVLEQEGS